MTRLDYYFDVSTLPRPNPRLKSKVLAKHIGETRSHYSRAASKPLAAGALHLDENNCNPNSTHPSADPTNRNPCTDLCQTPCDTTSCVHDWLVSYPWPTAALLLNPTAQGQLLVLHCAKEEEEERVGERGRERERRKRARDGEMQPRGDLRSCQLRTVASACSIITRVQAQELTPHGHEERRMVMVSCGLARKCSG